MEGQECGMTFKGHPVVEVGDTLEFFVETEIK